MRIQALHGPGPLRPTSGRAVLAQPVAPSSAPEVGADELAAARLSDRPVRDSADFPAWQRGYESQLGLGPEANALRRQALSEGGEAMLYRMFPLRFAEDLRGPYASMAQLLTRPAPELTLSGDCHLDNYGSLRHQDDQVLWSLNDYDQTGTGPADYDLCRSGASLALLARGRGWDEERGAELVDAFARAYARGLEDFAEERPARPLGLSREQAREPVAKLLKKAERKTQEELLAKWAEPGPEGFHLRWSDSLRPPSADQRSHLERLLEGISLPAGARVLDAGIRKDAGGSSLGLERFYLLAQKSGQKLPVVLELKQVLPSALASPSPAPDRADAKLLEDGFRSLGAPKDPWLRTTSDATGVYMLRERQRARDSVKSEDLSFEDAQALAKDAGRVLAQAHCLSGSPARLAAWVHGQKDELSQALTHFSQVYAEQVRRDFRALDL